MKRLKFLSLVFLVAIIGVTCDVADPAVDPNAPSPDSFAENATAPQLNSLVIGTLSQMRGKINTYIDAVGVVGREHYRFSGSDPRFVGDLLGAGGGVLDDNAFYTVNPYEARYATVKTTNILIDAVNNTASITDEQAQGYLGFAKTMKAHELLMVLNQQYDNGIRVDVNDPDNLGPFLSNTEALAAIDALLDEAAGHLANAGLSFAFPLSSGFEGFDTPATFRQMNRGLTARVAVYRGAYGEAISLLDESFVDISGDFSVGVYHNFSPNAGDQLNPLFFARNSNGDLRTAHPAWLADAEAGDNRLEAAVPRNMPFENADLTGSHDVFLYTSNTDPVPFLRNGELTLIYAEARIQRNQGTDLVDALEALNNIRNNADLSDYGGPITQADLTDEMLNQRRYELWFEGHRWVDMRRYDRLDELTIDRQGDIVHEQYPRPFNEQGVQGG